jgi:hypothetical protein
VATTGPSLFRSDRASEPLVSEATLRGQSATSGQELTYTCVPPGSGVRVGLDRDEDGVFDRDELDVGGDPAAAPSTTTTSTTSTTSTTVPTCTDGVRNGHETDVDCGGACCCPRHLPWWVCTQNPSAQLLCVERSCKRCRAGQACLCDTDCESGVCALASAGRNQPFFWKCAPAQVKVPDKIWTFDPFWWLRRLAPWRWGESPAQP